MTIVLPNSAERMDVALAQLIPDMSRSSIQKILEDGAVTCDGKIVNKKDKTLEGQVVEVVIPDIKPVAIVAQDIPLEIMFEDEDVIVINKPKGMVVHPAPGHYDGTLVNALLHHCKGTLSGINGEMRPGIVHRIDMNTSGLLIVAKNDFAHKSLAAQLADHSLSRVYEAIIIGNFREEKGTIRGQIGRHSFDRKRMCVTDKGGRDAITHWEVMSRFHKYSHIRCRLETGRTHQIRVHLTWQNHPILGDMVYGHKKPELGQDTQCLHARELSFIHPRTGESVHVESPLPAYFQALLTKLGNMY